MSIFVSVAILILSMLILASLQLTPGVFAILYHYLLGRFSKNKASFLSLLFILGVEVISACLFIAIYYLFCFIFVDSVIPDAAIFAWLFAGIFIALSFASFFFYYRRGDGTKLFITAKTSAALTHRAKHLRTNAEAFMLGIYTSTLELVFTLPLYVIAALEILRLNFSGLSTNLFAIIFIIMPIIPLFCIRWQYQSHRNLASIIRSRIKNKPFHRFILSFCYALIAIIIICFGTI